MGDRRANREPDLELPSIFGRRRKRAQEDEPQEPVTPSPTPAEDTTALPVYDAPAPAQEPPPPPADTPAREDVPGPVVTAPDEAAQPARGTRRATRTDRPERAGRTRSGRAERPARSGPALPAPLALAVTGVLVGLLGAGLTFGSLRGCDAVRGTSSCGGGPGLLLLVVIFVVMVLAGGMLLAALRVPEPRGTSFLAVGLLTVVVMVVLMNAVFSAWMFVAVPAVSAASYVLAGWVTTRLVDTTEDGPDHDVR